MLKIRFDPKSARMTMYPKNEIDIRRALLRGDSIYGLRYRVWHCDGVWHIVAGETRTTQPAPLSFEGVNELVVWLLAVDDLPAPRTCLNAAGEVVSK